MDAFPGGGAVGEAPAAQRGAKSPRESERGPASAKINDRIAAMTMDVDLPSSLGTLLHEVLEGPAETGAFVLNRGDKGLLASLDALRASCQRASRQPRVGRRARGPPALRARAPQPVGPWADPWSTADYSASWQRDQVTEDQWRTLREGLKKEAHDWMAFAVRRQNWDEQALTEALASVVHLAYHLGAIRQMAPATKGLPAHD